MDGSMAMRDEHPWTSWVTGWETVEVDMFIESSKIFQHSAAIILAFSESFFKGCYWKSAVVAGLSNCSGGERCFFWACQPHQKHGRLPQIKTWLEGQLDILKMLPELSGCSLREDDIFEAFSEYGDIKNLSPGDGWFPEMEKNMGGSPTQTRQMFSELFFNDHILKKIRTPTITSTDIWRS